MVNTINYNFSFTLKQKKIMKLIFNLLLFSIFTISFEHIAYSLSNYQIKAICKKKKNRSTCIKNLKIKKSNLLQGNQIEIPTIPFKK